MSEEKKPWERYAEPNAELPLRMTLPPEVARTVRLWATHAGLSPEQVVIASLAMSIYDERAWQATLHALRLAAHLGPST